MATNSNEESRVMASSTSVTMGHLEPFNVDKPGEWDMYQERFELFCRTNKIIDENSKAATLITVGGSELYKTTASILSPQKVIDVSYEEIITKLKIHFIPTKTIWSARVEFQRRVQGPDETAHTFMAALQKLANDCKFASLLDSMLITQFVCGIRDESVQRRLLLEKEDKLTKAFALETAATAESTRAQQNEIRKDDKVCAVRSQNQNTVSAERSQNRSNNFQVTQRRGSCRRCGRSHGGDCKYKNSVCNFCNKTGHLEKMCELKNSSHNKTKNNQKKFQTANTVKMIGKVQSRGLEPYMMTIQFGRQTTKFEVDSGSAFTIVSKKTFKSGFPDVVLNRGSKNIADYQGGLIKIHGETDINIVFKDQVLKNLPLIVVDCDAPSIIGRNWFSQLGISFNGVHSIKQGLSLAKVLDEFKNVFDSSLGRYCGPPIKFELKEGTVPIRFPPRNVPMALREPIEKELAKLESQGILTKIEYSDWTTPIVPVKKSNGTIRICGDYRSTVNQCIKPHTHKVPSINDLLSRLDGGVVFAKLDMTQAYQQLTVDEATAKMQAITTHKGTFAVNRLQFGISAAPGIFQSLVERLLNGLEGTFPYLDDFILFAENECKLIERLRAVFKILAENGLKLQKEKCVFLAQSIEFLGHRVSKTGISPIEDKIRAIKNAPYPQNKKELQATLGLIGFYQQFIPNKATIAEPLHRLLDKDHKWCFNDEHRRAIDEMKRIVTSKRVLVHYSLQRPLGVVADASPYGCGGVLFHIMEDGTERPIAFYSRTLSKAERNYSQLDREAVAILSAVKKFHIYLYGRSFKIYNDHRPLLGILGQGPCPQVISPQMLRRRIFLSAYDAELIYRPGTKMGNADFLSRAPLENESIKFVDSMDENVYMSQDLEKQTRLDKVLQEVIDYTRNGWPTDQKKLSTEVGLYWKKRNELTIERNCLLWGSRVVIPTQSRTIIMNMLHLGHQGIVRMKTLARQHVYWPSIDKDIEARVERCHECQKTRNDPPKSTHPWEAADAPWSRIHIDHAGPFRGKLYLIITDSFTRWLDVAIVPSTSTGPTVKYLRKLFAEFGIPDTIVSDNGTAFTSQEFSRFCRINGIQHYRVAPYMAASNGLAERNVQTVKNFLKKLKPNDDIDKELASFLLMHRTTRTSDGKSSSELLMGRQPQTCLDKIRPKKDRKISKGKFNELDPVWVRIYRGNLKEWVKGHIIKQCGHRVYVVKCNDSKLHRRHDHQIRKRIEEDWLIPFTSTEDIQEEIIIEDMADIPRRSGRTRTQTEFYRP